MLRLPLMAVMHSPVSPKALGNLSFTCFHSEFCFLIKYSVLFGNEIEHTLRKLRKSIFLDFRVIYKVITVPRASQDIQ